MPINTETRVNNTLDNGTVAGVVSVLGFLFLSVLAVMGEHRKVLVISWVAFAAMGCGSVLGARADETDPTRLVWGYGLASGAMITSAALFLVPQAIGLGTAAGTPKLGGVGIAAGILVGYSAHTISHRLSHIELSVDITAAQITAHALAAGLVIGLVYASMPELGLLLGLAIVSHKGPAGYAAARRLRRSGKQPAVLLVPAAGVGIAGLPASLLAVPGSGTANAVLFGFAAGIFLHVAMDFLPNCEAGSEIDEVCSLQENSHALLDRLRTHAVGSTATGAAVVVAFWQLLV